MHIRVKEAAAHVGLSVSTLNKLRIYGGGPAYYKLSRAVVYNVVDLDKWVASTRHTSTWSNDNPPAPARGVRGAA